MTKLDYTQVFLTDLYNQSVDISRLKPQELVDLRNRMDSDIFRVAADPKHHVWLEKQLMDLVIQQEMSK